ncbi:efflux transporter outer membrane subunit [Asticcacaulis sp. EMRT-3]|uniref:efflux transporter outer membrane subunit n=1 Tax=Asticcacaulis sp. EMRT-3 TaxID=3040349 RepID=UPI0024AF9A4E|nr:efflux transporter outer membrane subunit [Asticcacaulis sp. EMRT-3]MDI7773937.1 efflux transporter outer membrane subunit [Asticcacaulis sp. EMRT-3]
MTQARPRLPLIAVLLAATALSACTTLPQSAPFAREPSQAKKDNPIAAVSVQSWWKGFGDAQLNSLMNQALNNSPTLAIAEARLNQSEAVVSQYHASAGPNIGLNATTFEGKQSYNYLFGHPGALSPLPEGYQDYAQATLNFGWDLDFWGKNRAAISAATTTAQAAAADAAQARLMLSAAVTSAYIDLDRLYQERDLAQRAVEIRQDSAGLVQHKLDNGVTNRGEFDLAQANLYASKSDLAALDEQIELNKHLIATLIGASPDAAAQIQRPQLHPAQASFTGVPSRVNLDLIGRRPDIIAARWRAEAASARIQQAHAAFYPDINIAAFIGVQALHVDKLLQNGSDIGQVGPALSLPLFDGGALKANLKSAEAGHAEAIASYNEDVLTAMHQVADTLTSQRALADRLDNAQKALDADEEAYRLSKLRYDGGLSDYTTLLVAEQGLINQRRVVADLKSRALSLDVALIKSLGGQYANPA